MMEEVASQETSSQAALDFIDSSSLTYFIPQATKFQPEDEFDNDGGGGGGGNERSYEDIFKSIERRESLFFDESVDVYLVLRTAHVQEDILRSYLKRLAISLETHIVSGNALPERDHSPNSEVIYSGVVEEPENPITVLADKEDESSDDAERYTYALWKLSVVLARPRMRLQSPSAVFAATASLRPATDPSSSASSAGGGGDYLPSGVPSGLNLLSAFADDPAMNGIKPRLSALRVSRVTPVTQQAKDLLRPIRSLPKLALRVYPAVHSRIRFSRPHAAAVPTISSAAIIAMLELDFTPFFECEILLNSIDVSVRNDSNGSIVVDDLTHQASSDGGGGLRLPLSCVAHDHVTFLYRLAPSASAEDDLVSSISRYPSRELDIAITATALAEPRVCEPRLRMAWTATVDFTLPLNPGYGPALQPIQRSHRPSQLSIGGAADAASLTAPAVSRPDSLPSLEAATTRAREASLPELGVTVTFEAPPASRKIYPGDAFAWTVFVVNRAPAPASASASAGAAATSAAGATTPAAPPRKLALVAIPRRRRHDARVNRPPSVSSAAPPFPNGHHRPRTSLHYQQHQHLQQQHPRDRGVADAVLDESVVHALQRGGVLDDAPLASLSADVRVGPLAPGACHAAELRFLALRPGVHVVEAVRVVDLGSNEHVDVRELPTVVVEERV